jgi:two-component system, OmpR family, phosphate regulon sensor histidine kinase PhoR
LQSRKTLLDACTPHPYHQTAQVTEERKGVGVPLFALAALILGASGAITPSFWRRRAGRRKAGERAFSRERELRSIESISAALSRTSDAESIARVLLDEIASLFSVEFVGLALVDEGRNEASGLLARRDGEDFDFWSGLRFDLRREPSGIASAVFDVAPVTVYDTGTSPLINQAVAGAVGAQSAAFVPLVSGERVIAVLAIATTHERRAFSTEELGPLRTLAAEAALALERARSASALEEALERERLVSAIAHRLRSELDLDAVLRVAVEEIARALGLARCFIRLSDERGSLTIKEAGTAEPVSKEIAQHLPVSNAAVRRGATVAVADVGRELEGEGKELLLGLGSRAVLATPITVFGRTIGVLGLHRDQPHAWSRSEWALAEAVARELGLGINTARLLQENEWRLEQQRALLNAAQVVAGELQVQPVLEMLVDEVAQLLDADAADCYVFTPDRANLRCAAVHGIDAAVVGFEFPAGQGLAGRAIAEGAPVSENEYRRIGEPVPHPAYRGFAAAIVAPMTWAGETRGVLGVGRLDAAERPFTEPDVDTLATFATLASLALRNAESFEQRERLARVESGFSRIASLLGEPVSVTATLDAVAQAASEALGGDLAAVITAEPEGYRLGGAHALPPRLRKALAQGLPSGAEVLDHAAREGRTIASSALAGDDRFGDAFRAAVEAASLLAIPIVAPRSDRHALALVLFREPRTFTDDDLDLAGQLAERAKAALERSELFDVERRSRLLAQQLAQTGSLFSGELEPAAVLDEVVEQAPALLRADASSVRLLEGDELVAAAAVGAGALEVLGTRVAADARPAGGVIHSRAHVAIEDVGGEQILLDGEPMLGRRYTSYLAVPLFGAEGDLQGVLAVYGRRPRAWQEEEIEALRALAANASVAFSKAELYQQVELERERSVAILANVADGIVAVDREEQIVLWNDAAERITGVPSEEALGRSVLDVLQRELRSDTGTVAGDRLVPIRRADQEIWLSLTEAVMRDPLGETAGRIFAFRDISAERAVEHMRSDFVSTVSHELRAPLTSIYGFAATLLREDVQFEEEERRTFLTYIESEAERLTTIVDKLLSVARLDAGDLQLDIAPVDVRSLVSEVVDSAREAAVNGHEFVVDLPDVPLAARTDPEKLRQVLASLVDNAVRFSPAGGRVTIGAARRGETIVFSVADQGIGIPDAEQDRIFAKFYRVGDAQTGGTGVGLFIAQGLVNALGGRITVRSAEGRGSSFVVELPARDGGGRSG